MSPTSWWVFYDTVALALPLCLLTKAASDSSCKGTVAPSYQVEGIRGYHHNRPKDRLSYHSVKQGVSSGKSAWVVRTCFVVLGLPRSDVFLIRGARDSSFKMGNSACAGGYFFVQREIAPVSFKGLFLNSFRGA